MLRRPTLLLAAVLAATTACAGAKSSGRAGAVDDFGDAVPAAGRFARIVSLNPTTTELLFTMGAGARVVGRTRWDTYPDAARAVPDLGDGLRPNVETILSAHPDLVLLYASADNHPVAQRLHALGIATLSLKVDHISDFRRAATLLGRLLDDSAAAATVVDSVDRTLARVRAATAPLPHPTVFWVLWQSPLMAVGGGSYLDELLSIAGARNVYGPLPQPSPVVSVEDVLERRPSVIFVSPTAADQYRADRRFRAARVLVPDTTLIGHPSVRLGEAAMSLAALLHPGAVQ